MEYAQWYKSFVKWFAMLWRPMWQKVGCRSVHAQELQNFRPKTTALQKRKHVQFWGGGGGGRRRRVHRCAALHSRYRAPKRTRTTSTWPITKVLLQWQTKPLLSQVCEGEKQHQHLQTWCVVWRWRWCVIRSCVALVYNLLLPWGRRGERLKAKLNVAAAAGKILRT